MARAVRTLAPATADRPMVARPEVPLSVVPGETVTLFVGTSIWVRVLAGDGTIVLLDVPTSRPSDTWFGSLTRTGQLCYASLTNARLDLAKVQRNASRCITAVVVTNRRPTPLVLEHIRVPLPALALHHSDDGWLWTDTIEVLVEAESEPGEASIEARTPREGGDTHEVSSPRRLAERRFSWGVFASKLGLHGVT